MRKLLFLGVCYCLSYASAFSQDLSVNSSVTSFQFNIPNPLKVVSIYKRSMESNLFDSFYHPLTSSVFLWKGSQNPSISISFAAYQLIKTVKYLRKDSINWQTFRVFSNAHNGWGNWGYFANRFGSDTFYLNCSPSLDTFYFQSMKEDYTLSYVLKDSVWNAKANCNRFRIEGKYSYSKSSKIALTRMYNLKNNLIYSSASNDKTYSLKDTSIYGDANSIPDSFKMIKYVYTAYFPLYSISVDYNWSIENPKNQFQKVKFNNGDSFLIYSEKVFGTEGFHLIDTYIKKKRKSREGAVIIPRYSYKAITDFNTYPGYYILAKQKADKIEVMDFLLSLEESGDFTEDYYLAVPQNDSLDDKIEIIKQLIAEDYINSSMSNLEVDTTIYNIPLTNISKYKDNYGPFYGRFSSPLEDIDTWQYKTLYAGYLTKQAYKKFLNEPNNEWIEISKQQYSRHTQLFKENYIVFERTDSGFHLFDARFSKKVLSTSFNKTYYSINSNLSKKTMAQRIEDRKRRRAMVAYSKTIKKLYFNNQLVYCHKAKINKQEVWLFANLNASYPFNKYPYNLIDTLVYSFKKKKVVWGNSEVKIHELIGIKYSKWGWFYTSGMAGVKGTRVDRLSIYSGSNHIQDNKKYYSLYETNVPNTKNIFSFGGAYYTVDYAYLNNLDDDHLKIYLADGSDSFSIQVNSKKYYGSDQLLPFSFGKQSVLSQKGVPFSGAITFSHIPIYSNLGANYISRFILDSSWISSLNPQLVNSIHKLQKLHPIQTIINEEKGLPKYVNNNIYRASQMWDYREIPVFEVYVFNQGKLDSLYSYNYNGELLNAVKLYSARTESKIEPVKTSILRKEKYVYKRTIDFVEACYNKASPLDSLVPPITRYKLITIGFKEFKETNSQGKYRAQLNMGKTKETLLPVFEYYFDSARQNFVLNTFRHKHYKMADSAKLESTNGLLSGSLFIENNLKKELNAEVQGYRGQLVKGYQLIKYINDTMVIYYFNEKDEILEIKKVKNLKEINKMERLIKYMRENQSLDISYSILPQNLREYHWTTFYKNTPILKTEVKPFGEYLKQVNYVDGKKYLNWIRTDTCFNCVEGFVYNMQGKMVNKKYNQYIQYYQLYYPNGKLMGLAKQAENVRNWTLNYNCNDSSKFFTYPFKFVEYYDSLGNKTFNGDSGYMKLLGSHGLPVYESNFYNGVKNGLHKGYSPTGKLNEVGNYVNGLKNGIWYTGDLDGELDWDLLCSKKFNNSTHYYAPSDGLATVMIYEYKDGKMINQTQVRFKK